MSARAEYTQAGRQVAPPFITFGPNEIVGRVNYSAVTATDTIFFSLFLHFELRVLHIETVCRNEPRQSQNTVKELNAIVILYAQ